MEIGDKVRVKYNEKSDLFYGCEGVIAGFNESGQAMLEIYKRNERLADDDILDQIWVYFEIEELELL